jgi:hypothetical protein
MNTLTIDTFNDRITDVRRAYRLLHDYQRRILDTVKRVTQLIGRDVIGGYPLFSESAPRAGAFIDLNRSAWDWLSLYAYEFYFRDVESEEQLKFAIAFQADTGCYDNDVSITDTGRFREAHESHSYVYFYAGKEGKWKPENFQDIWEHGKDNHQFPGSPNDDKNSRILFAATRYPLDAFISEESIADTLQNANYYFESLDIKGVCPVVRG